MKYLLYVLLLLNFIFFAMSCNQNGEINTISNRIYNETPRFTATSTITPTFTITVTPTP